MSICESTSITRELCGTSNGVWDRSIFTIMEDVYLAVVVKEMLLVPEPFLIHKP